MSLEMPKELAWLLVPVFGGLWPRGDEDALRALADEWEAFGDQLAGSGLALPKLGADVANGVGGAVGRNFFRAGYELGKFDQDFVGMAREQAATLRAQALAIESNKLSMIIATAWLAAEIAQAILEPWFAATFPALVALVRFRVLENMIKGSAMKAAVVSAAREAVEEGVQDILGQLIQIIQGHRHGIDGTSLGMAVGMGAGAGAFAHGLQHYVAKYKPQLAASTAGAVLVEATTELAVGLASLPLGGDAAGLGFSVLGGAFSGAVTHKAHQFGHHLAPHATPKTPDIDIDVPAPPSSPPASPDETPPPASGIPAPGPAPPPPGPRAPPGPPPPRPVTPATKGPAPHRPPR
ncbi:hypothetical protein, partial [Amycolatopsis sp. NPDC059021]|uniref:WXG100-like domain-containing protein n=1 Tax=Amycolatopsis sp. NPDC059021 TaxID=3346704 RepID=UPI00366B580C